MRGARRSISSILGAGRPGPAGDAEALGVELQEAPLLRSVQALALAAPTPDLPASCAHASAPQLFGTHFRMCSATATTWPFWLITSIALLERRRTWSISATL